MEDIMGLYLSYKLEDQRRGKLYESQIKSLIINKEDEIYVNKFIDSVNEKNFNYSLAILYKRWNKIENENLKKDLINKVQKCPCNCHKGAKIPI